jgi:prolyl 4-hydroxylase
MIPAPQQGAAMNQLGTGIYTIDNVLSATECLQYIRLTEGTGYEAATITSYGGQATLQPEVRNNDRVMLDDVSLAAEIWSRIVDVAPRMWRGCQTIGLNERFRYYRYVPGQQFRLHVDGAFRRDNGEESKLTLLLYLNDGFEGGETKFDDGISVGPKAGMALLFDHRLLHEGAPLKSGTKYVMRTDVMCAPAGQFRG